MMSITIQTVHKLALSNYPALDRIGGTFWRNEFLANSKLASIYLEFWVSIENFLMVAYELKIFKHVVWKTLITLVFIFSAHQVGLFQTNFFWSNMVIKVICKYRVKKVCVVHIRQQQIVSVPPN